MVSKKRENVDYLHFIGSELDNTINRTKVKEMLLKSIKGEISKISSLKNYNFSLIIVHRNENKFLTEIYNGKCLHLFSILKYSGPNLIKFGHVIFF